jgi:hypothetical protein
MLDVSPKSLALLLITLVSLSHAADLPVARLDTISPPGGQIGQEVEVALTGADLDEASALHFSAPGITATPKDKHFLVKIAPNVPPGIYDLRVSGLFGISNPHAFVVGDLPQAVKSAANTTPATALDLPIDSTVTGTATAAAADYFKITAKKGQRLMIECDAAAIDSRLVPVLTILDPASQELDSNRREGFLDFTAPTDGTYLLKLHDLTFAGGADRPYRLTVTTAPHLDYTFPPCAKPGGKAKFTLFGRNLPGGTPANLQSEDGKPLEKLDVEIDVPATAEAHVDGLANPAAAAVDGFSYRLPSPHASNPVFIGLTNEPIVAKLPGRDKSSPQKITPPCEVVGQFFPAGDSDVYTFDAKKGESWAIEVVSNRLDLPTNPFISISLDANTVQEAYGPDTNVGGPRFRTVSNDPQAQFEAKADGAYRITVRDLFGNIRNDPRNVYRLVVRKLTPDFRLLAVSEPPIEKKGDLVTSPFTALLRAGGTTAIKVLAFRQDGFAGDIELHAEDLPPGVTCTPTTIPAGNNEGVVLVTTGEKPQRWAGAIRIIGQAKIGDAAVVHPARGGVVRWPFTDPNTDTPHPRLTRDIALGVTDADSAPISIAAAEDKRWVIPAGGKLDIPLKITHRGQFKEALKLKPFGAPGLEAAKEIDAAANAATAGAAIDLASLKLPPGEHTIHFEAVTKGKFRGKDVTTTIYSEPLHIAVQPPPAK